MASAIDWILVFVAFLIVSIPLGMIETLGRAIGGLPGGVLVYLVDTLALGVVVASRSVTVRLNTGRPGRESRLSTAK